MVLCEDMTDLSHKVRKGTRYKPARASRFVTLRFAFARAKAYRKRHKIPTRKDINIEHVTDGT